MRKTLFSTLALLTATLLLFSCGKHSFFDDVFDDVFLGNSSSSVESSSSFNPEDWEIRIQNPYANVSWDSWQQYKAAHHVHSTYSDGSNTSRDMLIDLYGKGFDIVAMADHRRLTSNDWTQPPNPASELEAALLTAEEVSAIRDGTFQNKFPDLFTGQRQQTNGMIGMGSSMEWEATNEPDVIAVNGDAISFRNHHLNSFFANLLWNDVPSGQRTIAKIANEVGKLGGLVFLNHPNRYTDSDTDATRSSDANIVRRYAELYMAHESIVGLEIVNRQDASSLNDRILWDNILKITAPQGRFAWGFSNDDAHSLSNNGHSWNVMLMPELSETALKTSMQTGAFYAVARRDRNISVNGSTTGKRPSINNIVIDDAKGTITISATDYSRIEWIADGKLIHTGTTLDTYSYLGAGINSYVRAVVIGSGVAYTQPFGITLSPKGNL
jgi:hypothetical protein